MESPSVPVGIPKPAAKAEAPADLAGRRAARKPWWQTWLGALGAVVAVYFFIAAINIMGHGLKTIAKVPASKAMMERIYHYADNPLAALCVGVLLTSLVQSSSFTTTFTVGLVAAGQIPLPTAIFIIMGANIGTSVTNTLVSLAHLRRRLEFRRSLAGATVHDFFNLLCVALLMPLEWLFGVISRPAGWLANGLSGTAFFTGDPKKYNFVKAAVRPLAEAVDWVLGSVFGLSATPRGLLTAALAIVLLFAALYVLVKILRELLQSRLEGLFARTLFAHPAVSFTVGIVTTSAVQSSSVTTSLVVPLVGAGVLKVRQIYPYTLGANIGTTVTAILGASALAALAAGQGAAAEAAAALALTVALAHLLFNVYGTAVFWPLQWIPISLAKGYAKLASKRRLLAAFYILVVFFLVPLAVIILANCGAFNWLLSVARA
jgi:sodium-dependent phosphate cotransporter